MRLRRRLISFITTIQSVLFLGHFFLYQTWALTPGQPSSHGSTWLKVMTAILSVSFVTASLLAFQYTNTVVRTFYRAAAVWLGLLSFLFIGAIASWIIFGLAHLAGASVDFHRIVEVFFALSLVTGLSGVF